MQLLSVPIKFLQMLLDDIFNFVYCFAFAFNFHGTPLIVKQVIQQGFTAPLATFKRSQ